MAYSESDPEGQANVAAFRQGLQKLGWTEGRNLRIDTRWAALDAELMQRFAKELIALQPDLILSSSTPTTATLLQQTRTIPIIFASRCRSGRQRLRREPVAAGRQRHRLHYYGGARWPASGWSCSRRLRRASPGLPSCSTRQLRHMPNIT